MIIEDVLRNVVREELSNIIATLDPFCTMDEAAKMMRCNARTAQTSLKKLGLQFTYAGRKPLVARADILRIANLNR